jgi:hypothetical protein
MLCWRAASGFGMPGISTVVGTGTTVAQPASSKPAMIAGTIGKRLISLLR